MKEQAQLTCTVSYSVGGLLFGVVLYRWRLITLVHGEARAALSLWLLQTLSQAENRRGRAGCRVSSSATTLAQGARRRAGPVLEWGGWCVLQPRLSSLASGLLELVLPVL